MSGPGAEIATQIHTDHFVSPQIEKQMLSAMHQVKTDLYSHVSSPSRSNKHEAIVWTQFPQESTKIKCIQ